MIFSKYLKVSLEPFILLGRGFFFGMGMISYRTIGRLHHDILLAEIVYYFPSKLLLSRAYFPVTGSRFLSIGFSSSGAVIVMPGFQKQRKGVACSNLDLFMGVNGFKHGDGDK